MNGQEKRERVIRGLEEVRDCEIIVYKYRADAVEDAIALLKAEEPCEDAISRKAAVEIAECYGLRNGAALGHHAGIADHIAEQIERLPSVILKAQEPRVMTLAEAVAAEVMFYEPRYVHHGVTKGLDVFPVIRVVDRFSGTVEWYSPYLPESKAHCLFAPEEYGAFGRCWTSRPTDEQRKAEPWKEALTDA